MLEGDRPLVRIFSPLVRKVAKTPELLDLINEINCKNVLATVQWIDDDVLATHELLAESLDKATLDYACNNMGNLADAWDTQVKEKFGGELMFTDDAKEGEEQVDI